MKKTKYLTQSALFSALGALLPQAFHIFGAQAGKTLLPMHIPAMIAGIVLGKGGGTAVGILSPILSSLLTGGAMPAAVNVPFLCAEIGAYGFFCGFFSKITAKKHISNAFALTASVFLSQICGRAVKFICVLLSALVLGINHPSASISAAAISMASGIPGAVLQLFAVPSAVIVLRKLAEKSADK